MPGDEDRRPAPGARGRARSASAGRRRPSSSSRAPGRRTGRSSCRATSGQARREEDVEGRGADRQDRDGGAVDRGLQPVRSGRQGRARGGGRSSVSSSASATSLTTGIAEWLRVPMNQVSPTSGHQPAGPVGRLVIPDRQPAVQVGQADRQVEQAEARPTARAHGDRLAGDRPHVPRTPIARRRERPLIGGLCTRGRPRSRANPDSGRARPKAAPADSGLAL